MMRITVAILIAIFITCCTKPGDVTLPPYEAKLVLHGYVAVGDTFKIALGKTMKLDALQQPERTYVSDGWVVLYDGNNFLDSLKYNAAESRYVSSKIIAASDKIYRIRAGAPAFPEVEATTMAPFPIPTVSLSHSKGTRRTSGGSLLDDVKFGFNDPAGQNNFYLSALYGTSGSTCVFTYDPAVEKYTMNLVPFDQGSCIDNEQILFTDKTFNGTLKELTLSTYSTSLQPFTTPAGAVYRPYLKRYHITEEYYRYFKTAINQDQIFEEGPILTDPRTAKGNVQNGYGLFTVFAVVTDTIR